MSVEKFEAALAATSESDWFTAYESVAGDIHDVDRAATRIWLSFYPLDLFRHLGNVEDVEKEKAGMVIQGEDTVAENIDTSHSFLYGHRYWNDARQATVAYAEAFDGESIDIASAAKEIAKTTANNENTTENLTLGISMVALMSAAQAGTEALKNSSGKIVQPSGILAKAPAAVVAERTKEPSRGLLGFLRTIDKEYQVIWDENDSKATFKTIYDEEIASGAQKDQSRDWLSMDERCGEGVIPVECRSAACGTCWVGVVGGSENLSDVERLERKQMQVFGYNQTEDAKPVMRLACQARAEGSVSIVIPKWNGVFGKKVYGVDKVVLKPATKSAAKLRETIEEALDAKAGD